MNDPTYVKEEIEASPLWRLAFSLSEIINDEAPIGWGKYIWVADCLITSGEVGRLLTEFQKDIVQYRDSRDLFAIYNVTLKNALEEICRCVDMRSGNGNSHVFEIAHKALSMTSTPERVINLVPEDFEEMLRILESPPQPNTKLIELLRGYTIISQGWPK